VFVCIVGLVGVLYADAKDDLSRAKSDDDSLKSKTDELEDRTERYLETSRNLRSMDKDQLGTLVEKLCKLDIEPDEAGYAVDGTSRGPGQALHRRGPPQVQGRRPSEKVQTRRGWLSDLPPRRRNLYCVSALIMRELALGAAVYFDHELAPNPAPIATLWRKLAADAGEPLRHWWSTEKAPQKPRPLELDKLVAKVASGETVSAAIESEQRGFLVLAQTTPVARLKEGVPPRHWKYDAVIAFGPVQHGSVRRWWSMRSSRLPMRSWRRPASSCGPSRCRTRPRS
jgi:hypothetical protein